MDITSDLKKAKRGAIAKAISIFENDEKESRKLIKKILIFNSKKCYSNLSEITINFIKILYIKFLLKLEYL